MGLRLGGGAGAWGGGAGAEASEGHELDWVEEMVRKPSARGETEVERGQKRKGEGQHEAPYDNEAWGTPRGKQDPWKSNSEGKKEDGQKGDDAWAGLSRRELRRAKRASRRNAVPLNEYGMPVSTKARTSGS